MRLDNLGFEFYREVENPGNGAFTGCAHTATGENLTCFRRTNSNGNLIRSLDRVVYKTDLTWLDTQPNFAIGEDPRVLNSTIVFDNFYSDMYMIDVITKKRYEVHVNGSK